MAKNCDVCGLLRDSARARKDGKVVCSTCLSDARDYNSHWFPKSLEYKPPRPPALKKQPKPLPNQQELFERGDDHA